MMLKTYIRGLKGYDDMQSQVLLISVNLLPPLLTQNIEAADFSKTMVTAHNPEDYGLKKMSPTLF